MTPTIDRTASQGWLWDRWIATEDDPLAILKQYMGGTWLAPFRSRGSIELLTDDPALSEVVEDHAFDLIHCFDPVETSHTTVPAETIEETQLAQLFSVAIERCRDAQPLGAMWLHSRFLATCWDAPRDLVTWEDFDQELTEPSEEPQWLSASDQEPASMASAEIPWVFDNVLPPFQSIDFNTHPDLVTAWMRTYACQVRLFDELLELWLQSIPFPDWHLVIAGTSGFGLGQNGWIGHRAGPLRSQDLRLPLIVRRSSGGKNLPPLRVPGLARSTDLPTLLAGLSDPLLPLVTPEQWCHEDQEFEPLVRTNSSRAKFAITTPHWFCVQDQSAESNQAANESSGSGELDSDVPHLFVKPDDVDDANDIGRIRPSVVERLAHHAVT